MNEITTQELMLHVERIVRPIGATQGRKLRMRTELLAHLTAALDEERLRFPGDERAAFEQAKARLGEPAELTRQFQQAVPSFERMLLSEHGPKTYKGFNPEHLQQRLNGITGLRGVIALEHRILLIGTALLLLQPLLWSLCHIELLPIVLPEPETAPVYATSGWDLQDVCGLLLFLVQPMLTCMLSITACRFVFRNAEPTTRSDSRGIITGAATILVLQIVAMMYIVRFSLGHFPTMGGVATCTICTLILLAVVVPIARYIGVQRRLGDQWQVLEIAD